MISVTEAYQIITSYQQHFGTETIPFQQSLNRVLARDVVADRDVPPFDRVMMDGIAIQSECFEQSQRSFFIENISSAGSAVQSLLNKNNCIEVMTGAVLPLNTDAVIPYEDCKINNGIATITVDSIKHYQNVHRQASDEKKEVVLLRKNKRITATYISILATVGMSEVEVYQLPKVAICSTGDELVPVHQTPLPHQIRQSNVYFIAADLQKENISASIHHLPDDKEVMKLQLSSIIHNNDVVLLSGAVSKGKFDYLPQTLASLGLQTIFHRVAQRPGKPFLLGTINKKMVFGFPGNPVSTFVCYHLFFQHWLQLCWHQSPKTITAKLAEDVMLSSSLTNHLLVKLVYKESECFAEPISLSTSGDVISMIEADGIISFHSEKNKKQKSEVVDVVLCK